MLHGTPANTMRDPSNTEKQRQCQYLIAPAMLYAETAMTVRALQTRQNTSRCPSFLFPPHATLESSRAVSHSSKTRPRSIQPRNTLSPSWSRWKNKQRVPLSGHGALHSSGEFSESLVRGMCVSHLLDAYLLKTVGIYVGGLMMSGL